MLFIGTCSNSIFNVLLQQELVMDILRVLNAPDQEVRKKTLSLALELVTSRSVEEVRDSPEDT